MHTKPEIVDRGRGPQLSHCRITVQDLVPYLQQKLSYQEIIDIIPILTEPDIEAITRYVEENYDAVMEQDRRIRVRNANRKNSPQAEESLRRGGEKMAALREEFKKKKLAEENGAHPDG